MNLKALLGLIVVALVSFTAPRAQALPAINDPKIEKLKTAKLTLAGQPILAEMAVTDEERERGLMYRKAMGAGEGMLFIFEDEQPMAFWMKNTLIPLSIGYFDKDRKLINTLEMTPAVLGDSRPQTYPAGKPALYALEMNKGWFAKHGIKPGAELKIPKTFVERKQGR